VRCTAPGATEHDRAQGAVVSLVRDQSELDVVADVSCRPDPGGQS
jgi:hypothetical protein